MPNQRYIPPTPRNTATPLTNEPPLLDAHAHIFPRDVPLMTTAWARPDYGYTAEEYLADLDSSGVHFGVIAAMSLSGDYNDYVIQSVAATPRLRGTVNIGPSIRPGELRDMNNAGIVGMRLFRSLSSFGEVDDITSDEYQVLFRRIRDLGWHVHMVVEPSLFDETLDVLNAAGVKIVIDHFGNPDLDLLENCPRIESALRSVQQGRTWIKISAGYRLTEAEHPRVPADYVAASQREHQLDTALIAKIGTDRLLWGSDAPFVGHEGTVSYQDTVDSYIAAVPTDATRRAIDRTSLKFFIS